MTKVRNDDAKKFIELKELLEIVKNKIDMMEVRQTSQSATISLMKDQLSVINSKLDFHSASLITIENTINGYADMYKINKSNIERLDDRVSELEENAGIIPPSELTIQRE